MYTTSFESRHIEYFQWIYNLTLSPKTMRFSHHILPLLHGLSALLTQLRHLISAHSFFANDILSTNRPLVPRRCFMLYPWRKKQGIVLQLLSTTPKMDGLVGLKTWVFLPSAV